jgi:hypothetical protein
VTFLFIIACFVLACTVIDMMDEVLEFFSWLIKKLK